MQRLPGFEESSFSYEGVARPVFRRGSGPAVVVMHEVPGITPPVTRFTTRVADAGFSVFLPHLFGEVGRPFSMRYVAKVVAGVCVSREFKLLAKRESSPITQWLRALARSAHTEIGGKGVGAIGMCLTGNFALALSMDEAVMAPVLSQPSLPIPLLPGCRAALHISDKELENLKARSRRGLKVLGMRFTGDPSCTQQRFDHLRGELGSQFEAIEIDSSRGNAHGIRAQAHSVVTEDLVDEEGHPTRAALDRVISFFREELLT
jgi:dienelactone hydrolase